MKTDNELIAEFMGLTVSHEYGLEVLLPPDNPSAAGYLTSPKYDTSWDWLMPVVEKIEVYGHPVLIESNFCRVGGDSDIRAWTINDKIQCVYTAVVMFINWYNENKKQAMTDNQQEVKHTPIPWKIERYGNEYTLNDNEMRLLIGKVYSKKDAEFIIEACNNYHSLQQQNERLKATVKALLPMAEDGYRASERNGSHQEFLSEDREIIAAANQLIQNTPKP